MRSLYFRIALASFLTVVVSWVAFAAIAHLVIGRTIIKLFTSAYSLQLEEAVDAYATGGPARLGAFVGRMDAAFGVEHHVTDASGRDLATGVDRSALLRVRQEQQVDGHLVFVRASQDGRYRLIGIAPPPFTAWTFAPFYLLVLAAIAFVSWLAAIGIASPLRTAAAVVDRFGQGDLSARVTYQRKDEIGTLATSFNQMADRIQTLLTAERRLLQDIGHELRSPLARLNMAIELARTAPDRNAAIDRLQKEADRLSSLTGQLLEVTRAEGDPSARKTDPIPLDEVVHDIVQICAVEAEARHCRIVIRGESARQARGDRELLRRAMENVLRNAIRFSPAGSDVDVHVQDAPAQTTIAIRDLGEGVPDDVLTRIFDSFYRVDESRDGATGGIGLGLAIAYRAIHLHHGSVTAENVNPGLRVTLAIPSSGAPRKNTDQHGDIRAAARHG